MFGKYNQLINIILLLANIGCYLVFGDMINLGVAVFLAIIIAIDLHLKKKEIK